jgi:4'-phosphopantetheinyl transferase
MLPLAVDHADVWLAWPDAADAATVSACRALLDSDERAQHDRFRFERDRALYAVAHALVRRALSRYAAVSPADWRFVADAHGWPAVDAATGLPRIGFNLSHTRGLAACVVSGAPACGVDVEEMRANVDLFELADHSFAAAETAGLRALAGDDRAVRDRFYALWTLKESYIKARGLGLALPLGQFAFTVDGDGIGFTVDAALGDDARRWSFALGAPSPDHRLAVCVARDAGATPNVRFFTDPLHADAGPLALPLIARAM